MPEVLEKPTSTLEAGESFERPQNTFEKTEFNESDLEQEAFAAESNVTNTQGEVLTKADERLAKSTESLALDPETMDRVRVEHATAIESAKEKIVTLGQETKQKISTVVHSEAVSEGLNLVPIVGGAKMGVEAAVGKTLDGREIEGVERVVHGAKGIGSMTLDLTGVGEVREAAALAGRSEVAADTGKLVVKEFSKRYAPMARDILAGQLRELKKRLLEDRTSLREGLVSEQAEKNEDLRKMETEYAALETKLNQEKSGFVSRFFHRAEISTLEADLAQRKATLGQLKKDFKDRAALLGEAGTLSAAESDRSQIRARLDSFYKKQEDIKGQFETETDARSVDQICKKENVFFIHGMAMEGELQSGTASNNNSVDGSKVSFETKTRLIRGLEPTISCSTLKLGDTNERMTQKAGLILSKGQVLYAKGEDAYTVMENGSRRSKDESQGYNPLESDIQQDPEENIKSAIHRTKVKGWTADSHNELIVENPQCAGVFFDQKYYLSNQGLAESVVQLKQDRLSQLKMVAEKMGVPLYMWTEGGMVEYGKDDQPVPVDQVLERSPILSSTEKRSMLEAAVAEEPFKIDAKIQSMYRAYTDGALVYDKIFGDRFKPEFPLSFTIPTTPDFDKFLKNIERVLERIPKQQEELKTKLRTEGISYSQARHYQEEAQSVVKPEEAYMLVYATYQTALEKKDSNAAQILSNWLEKNNVLTSCQDFVKERIEEDGSLRFIPEKDVPKEVRDKLKTT